MFYIMFKLNSDIMNIISKYLKCKTNNCNILGNREIEYSFWQWKKGFYCSKCFNLFEKEREEDEWIFRDDHGIRL